MLGEVESLELPLTLAQRGLWIGHKIAAADATMNIAEALELRGPIDVPVLLRAVDQLVDELQAARIRIVERDGIPYQSIRASYHGELTCIDVSDSADPLAAAVAWVQHKYSASLDLAHDPLWQSVLLRLGSDHYLWYQQAHHVVFDGFSGGLAARRMAEIYTAIKTGSDMPASGFGAFSELLLADTAYRESARFARDRSFWQEQLKDLPEAVTLSRRGRQRSMGGLRRASGQLSPQQVGRLAALGRTLGASLPQVLISLIAAYYHRATGADDLVIGMPVTGRVSAAARAIPAMMANAVAIRLQFSTADSAASLIVQVAKVVRQSLRHQQYRYEDVRRDLGLLGQDQHLAWLGVNIEPFDYQLDLAGTEAVPMNLCNGSVEDLTVFFYERGDGRELRFDFDANPALYDLAELEQHRDRWLQLLEAALAEPERPLWNIEVLLAEERQRLLQVWRGRLRPTASTSLPSLLDLVAEASPDATAIWFRDQATSYRALQQLSWQVASVLRREGLQPGQRVGIGLPREPLLVATLLAVLRLGAAYVPIDLDAPPERSRGILADAQPSLLLLAADDIDDLGAWGGRSLNLAGQLADEPVPAQAEVDLATPHSIAYVLYTSGSTGQPKGVEISHANLVGFLTSMQSELALRSTDRFLAQTTMIFDIAGLELYLPLLCGASVVLAERADLRQPRRMAALIASNRVSHVQATPSLWRMLLAVRELVLNEVHVLVGGEALGLELARQLWQRSKQLTQLYGPTETTIWSTIESIHTEPVTAPTIGRPLGNTLLYVLDAQMQPALQGAIGELYIGGHGVASGYLNRPELTASRFVPDPWAADGARMYRTGDRVRWNEHGHLEFIGRGDQQLKIRGHRVEPGEIEHHLNSHPAVADAAVIGHQDDHGGTSLLAYVSMADGHSFDGDAIRLYLSQRLPAYMLPASLLSLPQMPLTANGKLDRKALPLPELARRSEYAAPVTALEWQVASLWQELFGLPRVGRHDNFFELGGDSLTAAQMMARLSETFGTEWSLASLFESATVAGLAAKLQQTEAPASDPLAPLLTLRAGVGERPLFCVHPVVGIGWAYASLLRHLDPAIPVYSLQAAGLRAKQALPASLQAMAGDYITILREVQPHGPYRLLGWSLGGLLVQAIAAKLQAMGEEIELLALMDAYPFIRSAPHGEVDESHEAAAALQFLGIEVASSGPAPQTLEAVAQRLCEEYGIAQLPVVQRLQVDDPDLLTRVASVTRHHLTLARQHVPPTFAGSALYFQAQPATGQAVESLLQYRPSAWAPHIVEGLQLYPLDCRHQQMLEPGPAAQIGKVLNLALAASAGTVGDQPVQPSVRNEALYA